MVSVRKDSKVKELKEKPQTGVLLQVYNSSVRILPCSSLPGSFHFPIHSDVDAVCDVQGGPLTKKQIYGIIEQSALL